MIRSILTSEQLEDKGRVEDGDFIGNARQDIPMLLAEIERLRKGITAIGNESSCDDTWDYANRLLEGKEISALGYRIGGD